MTTSRKERHIKYLADRIFELHEEIVNTAVNAEKIDTDLIYKNRDIIRKYRRRLKLVKI